MIGTNAEDAAEGTRVYAPLVDDALASQHHPAIAAWLSFADFSSPSSVESLKSRRTPARYKSYVYRLVEAGPGKTDVVAKLALSRAAELENAVYQHLLPALDASTVTSYGTVPSRDYPGMAWLFIEYAGDESYNPSDIAHQRKAADWLSHLHAASRQITDPPLDGLEPPEYRSILSETSLRLAAVLRVGELPKDQREIVGDCLTAVQRALESWDGVDEYLADLPKALVHGDFKARNLRIWGSRPGAPIAVLDWGEAHWGPFAVDLHSLDIEAYRRDATRRGLGFGDDGLERARRTSVLLRMIVAIHWETSRLERGGRDRAVRRLHTYGSRLSETLSR
jgi:Ser/Thr protein kinase RdoA (MazF antagonist)